MARKKKEETKEEVKVTEETMKDTSSAELNAEEQANLEEQQRQQRIAACTEAVRQSLAQYQCDLDISMILRMGQVIPRVSIVPIEVLRAQREALQQAPSAQ